MFDEFGRLESLRAATGFDHDAWADILCLSRRDYDTTYLAGQSPGIDSIAGLCETLNISLANFVNNDIDCRAIFEQFHGNRAFFPEKYLVDAFSKQRTPINLFHFTKTVLGTSVHAHVCKSVQVWPAFLDAELPVSITMGFDILKTIDPYVKHAQSIIGFDFYTKLGANLMKHLNGSAIQKGFSKARSLEEMYELGVNEYSSCIESNCAYRLISLTKNHCVIASSPTKKLVEALKSPLVGNSNVCEYRTGVLAALPKIIGLPATKVIETRCIHRGDPKCLFFIDITMANRKRLRAI